jgi:phage shock protein E
VSGSGAGAPPPLEEWSAAELAAALADPERTVVLLDVRTPGEFVQGSLPGAVSMPLDEIDARHGELGPDAEIVCLCPNGERAAVAAVILHSLGHGRAALLAGGLDGMGIETDRDDPGGD